MKKLLLLLVLFIIVGIPTYVFADDDINYTVDQYYIDAYIQKDGSLEVLEYFIQTGTFNGYYRDILYKDNKLPRFTGSKKSFYSSDIYNGSRLELIEIGDMTAVGDYWHRSNEFKNVNSARNGEYGVYTVETLFGKARRRIQI